MTEEKLLKLEQSIENLKSKKSKIYLLVQDTKGNAKASIAYIYRLGLALQNNGFNPIMLHEKPEYTGVSGWLTDDVSSLPHQSIEGQQLQIAPEDFIVLPELYGFVMSQIAKLPCGKIVLCQAYDHMLETLQPGETWSQFGFIKCITTSEIQKEFIENVFRGISYEILKPYISDVFEKQSLPPKPIVAIHSRDQRDAVNIIKAFYIKFPQYRWITFRDMRGLTEKEFATALKDCFLSVWVDDTSAYGTFPLESMKVGVPVLGLVPNLVPTWMNEDNGLWINNQIQLVDFIADFLQNWLEDNVNPELYKGMEKTVSELPTKENFETLSVSLFEQFLNTRMESFLEQLSKLITIEE
jgi:glycosyltransferase involved in cell wall biosynthesis